MLGIPNEPGPVIGKGPFSESPAMPGAANCADVAMSSGPAAAGSKQDLRAFIITIDTEGDNEWARPNPIETRNASYLPRFQALCEEFGFKTTWLTDYEMANSADFVRFGRSVIDGGAGEIGMHLHAWSSPPIQPLTRDDHANHPYLIEFPAEVMAAKIGFMTNLLEQQFGTKMVSHRAGRWAINGTYARLLAEHGYLADCSVTPHISWRHNLGDPDGDGGPDYRHFPSWPYFIDFERIDQPGKSPLLEVPPTIVKSTLSQVAPWAYTLRGLRRFAWRWQPPVCWIAPDGDNLRHMRRCVSVAVADERPHIQLSIHSSELMPGGSPLFRDAQSIEDLYGDLRALFEHIAPHFKGATLKEFRADWNNAPAREPATR